MFGRLHVLPVIAKLLHKHPLVRADLLLTDRNVRLIEEGIDIAVRIGPLDDSSLHAICIGSVRQCLVASPSYITEHGIPEQPDQLQAHNIIGGESNRAAIRWHFKEPWTRGVDLMPKFEVNSVDARLAAAAVGLGIANVLSYQVKDALASGTLRLIMDAFAPSPLPIHLLFHPNRSKLPAVRCFIEMMKKQNIDGDGGIEEPLVGFPFA